MPNPFDAAAKAAAASSDAVLAEPFTFRPMKRGANVNTRDLVDPALPVKTGVLCVFGEPSARVASGAVETVGVRAEKPGHASSRPFVSLALSRLPYRPQKGFVIEREATGEKFRIAEVLPSTPGFVRCDLNFLSQAPGD